jgi:Right handed beta helix region
MLHRYVTAVFLLLGLAPVLAWGATYTVSKSGNNSSCSNILTIDYGVRNCARQPGDILDIRAGTYAEQLHHYDNGLIWPSGTASQRITFRGHAGEEVIIRADAYKDPMDMVYGINVSYITFDNLTFDGAGLGSTQGQLMKWDDSHHIRVQNCLFRNGAERNAIQASGPFHEYLNNEIHSVKCYGFYVSGSDNLFDNNYVHDTGGYGIHLYHSFLDCPDFNCVNRNVIRNNRLVHNSCTSLYPGSEQCTGAAFVMGQGSGNVAYNNEIRNQCRGGVQYYDQSSNAEIYNNTIVGSSEACMSTGDHPGGGNTFKNNICYNNGGGDFGGNAQGEVGKEANWLSANGNPNFVNYGAADLHLTAASDNMLRNGGVQIPGLTLDRDNNARDSTPSLGAYEFGTGFSPVISTFYIATNGTDAVDCTAAQSISTPRAKLANVLPCAAGGSTIWYRSGIYTDTQGFDSNAQALVGGTSTTNVTRIGTLPSDRAGGLAELRSTTGNVLWFFHGNPTDQFITIESLILDSRSVSGSNVLALYPGAHDIILSGVTARNAHFEPVFIFGASGITLSGVTVTGSTVTCAVGIYNNSSTITLIASALESTAGGGVCSSGGLSGLRVERSVLRSMSGPAISITDASAPFIVNNLIYSNPSGITLGAGTTNAEVYHNTIWNNTTGAGLTLAGGVTSTVRNNILFANGSAISGTPTTASDNVTANPIFVNPGPPTTFHVQGANVVNAATVSPSSVSTDFNGTGRTVPYTIGAYEDNTVGTTPTVSLTATPTTITAGNASVLNWSSSNATSCSAPWTGSTGTSGSQSVSPTITTTYTMTCTDGTTPVSANATVTVTGTPSVSLTATPSTITAGQSSTLSWTSSNVTSCSAPWTGSTATSGSQSVSPTITTTYTITCTDGTTPVSSNATVTVGTPSALPVRVPAYGTTGALLP